MERLTNMDGGVLVDPQGQCHAIGIVLDGTARGNGDPARGSRYNNAVRYLDSDPPPTVVLCYSSDGDIAILPALRPRRRPSEIEALVQRYVTACSASPPQQRTAAAAEERIRRSPFLPFRGAVHADQSGTRRSQHLAGNKRRDCANHAGPHPGSGNER